MAEIKNETKSAIVGRDEFEALKGEMQSGISAIMAQLSAIAQVNDGRSRPSRDQESAQSRAIHDAHDQWDGDTLLNNPGLKPRTGYRQMWVRTAIAGEADGANVARMMNKGWRPRKIETIEDVEMRGSCLVDFEGGQVIGWRGTVLFEIDEERALKMIARRDLQSDIMMRGVEENLMRTHDRSQTGFGAPHFIERKRSIEKGRPAESLID